MGRKLYSNSLLDMIDDFADRMAIDDFEALSPGIGGSALRPKGMRPVVHQEELSIRTRLPETPILEVNPSIYDRKSGFARLGIQIPTGMGKEVERSPIERPFIERSQSAFEAPKSPERRPQEAAPATIKRRPIDAQSRPKPKGQLTGLLHTIESQKKSIAAHASAHNKQSARRWIARSAGLAMDLFAFSSASLFLIGGVWFAVSRSIRPDAAASSVKPWQVAWSWVQYFKPAEMALGFAVFFALYHLVFKVVVGRTVGQAVSRRLSPESGATEQAI